MTDIQWMLAVAVYVVVGFVVFLGDVYLTPSIGIVNVDGSILIYLLLWPFILLFAILVGLGKCFFWIIDTVNDAGYRRKYGNRTDT